MSIPVNNDIITMFTSGNIQQEIAGILSVSNSGILSFSNYVRRVEGMLIILKLALKRTPQKNSMSVVHVQCNWKIKQCAKLYRRETLSNIQSCSCNLRMNGSEQKSTTISIIKSIWTCIWGLNLWSGILRHLRNKNYLFQDDYETVYSSNATKLWKTEYKIEFLTWPSQSQDMSMIKNVRKIIKLSIQKDVQNIYNRNGLSQS